MTRPPAYVLEIEALDLGPEVKAVGVELVEANEFREPVRGTDAAPIWSRILPAVAGPEPWVLDFFSHLDRVRDYCQAHEVAYREGTGRSVVIPAPKPAALTALFERFAAETFGARAGGPLLTGDPALENGLAGRGVDAYHTAFANYFFCAVCDFENASLVLLTNRLWSSEVIRRVRPVTAGLDVELRLPN
jgi:hypothetical protein